MSCERIESRIIPYVDGRLKENERQDMEKHLVACSACRVRVNEFRAVSGLLDELPVIEPSSAFDTRVHALVAAEPPKRSWFAWLTPSPRIAFAASLLLVATLGVGMNWWKDSGNGSVANNTEVEEQQILENKPVLENYDVLANFEVLSDLSQQPDQPAQGSDQDNTDQQM